MGYTIKQKIDICLKAEANPHMTQSDLAKWAHETFKSGKQPSQTTISRILSSKNDLVASKQTEFQLVRRRKKSNPVLRQILTEWVTQLIWESIPITTPIIQSTSNAIWNRLPMEVKDGNGIFNQKWCTQFVKSLNINLTGTEEDINENFGYKLNKIWLLDDKLELKNYLHNLIQRDGYGPQDMFTIDEFQLFYSMPLDQIFDTNSVDKGLKQLLSLTENSLTIMLGTNFEGSEKLTPLIVGKNDRFDLSQSSVLSLRTFQAHGYNGDLLLHSQMAFLNKLTETYNLFYKNNINKWITSTMFQNYLLTLEHKLASNNPPRKIVIIVDDSSTHRILNVKFNNIKLVYLKNNSSHKPVFNSLFNGVNFDYCPMNFGIVHEFKTLYRLQQYLEMINIQQKRRHQPKDSQPIGPDSLATDVLSEPDYNVPLIKAIEWIKRAWESLTTDIILQAWCKTHLINIQRSWPNNAKLIAFASTTKSIELLRSYKKLQQVMGQLNVILPWSTEDLLGLINERSKATLNYISIEEIVTSCLLETVTRHVDDEPEKVNNDNWIMSQMLNPSINEINDMNNIYMDEFAPKEDPQFSDKLLGTNLSINALLAAAQQDETSTLPPTSMVQNSIPQTSIPQTSTSPIQLPQLQLPRPSLAQPVSQSPHSLARISESGSLKHKLPDDPRPDKRRAFTATPQSQWNDSLPSSTASSPYNGPILFSKVYSGITYKSLSMGNLHNFSKNFNDKELLKLIIRLLEAAQTGYLNILKETVADLKLNLKTIRSRQDKDN